MKIVFPWIKSKIDDFFFFFFLFKLKEEMKKKKRENDNEFVSKSMQYNKKLWLWMAMIDDTKHEIPVPKIKRRIERMSRICDSLQWMCLKVSTHMK